MGRSQWLQHEQQRSASLADDSGCSILHVDMDAFYASVEVRRRPELRGKPVIVGGVGNRGVVCSATYEARQYGVRSAMPVARALRLCPPAIVLPVDGAAVSAASKAIMAIFRDVTPLVEPLSLDEAFLDVGGARRLLGSAATIAAAIRARVQDEQQLTCSVGIASTKFVAKVASVRCKPDGMLVVPADGVLEFLHPLPIAALWGVGPKTEERLHSAGLDTIGDLAAAPVRRLESIVGRAGAAHLHALALGRDPRAVEPESAEKSIGAEETFGTDVGDPEIVYRELLGLAAKTASRLRAGDLRARTVAIKIRRADFTTLARSRTLERPTDSGQELYAVARELYDILRAGPDLQGSLVRLVGIRAEGIVDGGGAQQLVLGERENGWREADAAMDAARARFGNAAITQASLVRRESADQPDRRTGRPAAPLGDR